MGYRRLSVLFALCSILTTAGSTCTLPSALQTSTWVYTGGPNTPLTLTFGPSTMSGLILSGKGTTLSSYDCISNVANVFVFRSTFPYSDRGNDRYLFLCMRLTQVSNDLFYFYLLSDIETTGVVSPQDRVLNPPYDNIPPNSNPTCSFCSYTTAPPDADVRTLQRSGTSESLPAGITACLPCEATCIATTTMSTTITPASSPVTSTTTSSTVTSASSPVTSTTTSTMTTSASSHVTSTTKSTTTTSASSRVRCPPRKCRCPWQKCRTRLSANCPGNQVCCLKRNKRYDNGSVNEL